ncbi:Phage protein [Pseudomonas yamanorum]
MDGPTNAEEIRALLLSQHPSLADDLAKISDLELLQFLLCAYECAIDVNEAELMEAERRLDAITRALFSPVLH